MPVPAPSDPERPSDRPPVPETPEVSTSSASRIGQRLVQQERRLRLLLSHLAGKAIRARIELEDLVQEVFVRALGTGSLPPEEAGDAPLARLLSRIARNTVVDAARAIRAAKRDGKTERLAHSDWSRAGPRASQIVTREMGPPTGIVAAEERERLFESFEALSPEHRRVIGLRQFEGLSARDAARRMGRSETAVHSLYRRALAAWEEGAS